MITPNNYTIINVPQLSCDLRHLVLRISEATTVRLRQANGARNAVGEWRGRNKRKIIEYQKKKTGKGDKKKKINLNKTNGIKEWPDQRRDQF
ncbi:hypothetical protein E2C01_053262 [Portunus trituberculatus]|uniref:Uncharacterized protein n=1 Tax=Portunus trituberculatus TaxID=210409 RepID=A0A5B7GP11_PORTR|nr:hypothetical protein [Portunus trituberculatus]